MPDGDLWHNGPTGGIAATIVAIGTAVLLIAWKALPIFKEWAAAIHEVRGIGTRAAARLDDLIQDHIRLAADVKQLLALVSPTPEFPTMADQTHELTAVTAEVKHKLHAAAEPEPGQLRALDLDQIMGFIGSVDGVVQKLYPILAPLLPGNVATIAQVIFQIITALAHKPGTPA